MDALIRDVDISIYVLNVQYNSTDRTDLSVLCKLFLFVYSKCQSAGMFVCHVNRSIYIYQDGWRWYRAAEAKQTVQLAAKPELYRSDNSVDSFGDVEAHDSKKEQAGSDCHKLAIDRDKF